MRKPATQALVCWLGGFTTLIAVLFLFLGKPLSAEGASEAVGRGFAHTGIAALCVWLYARSRPNPWTWARFVVVYVATFIVLGVVSTRGLATSERSDSARWPFAATFPEGWVVERLAGASSAPQDKDLGVREIARHDAGEGAPVIQLGCVWRKASDSAVDLDAFVGAMAAKLESHYKSARTRVENSEPTAMKLAKYSGKSVTTKIFLDEELVFQQESLVATTDHCLFSAQVGALPSEFANAAKVFEAVVRDMKTN